MGRKADLQAEASALGITFAVNDTIAVLEAKIAEAESENTTVTLAAHPGPNERFEPGLCPVCGIEADHIHSKGI